MKNKTSEKKTSPTVLAYALAPDADEFGRRLLFRLLEWPDGGRSIAIGLTVKIEGSQQPSTFVRGHYVSLPVSILTSLELCARSFSKKASDAIGISEVKP